MNDISTADSAQQELQKIPCPSGHSHSFDTGIAANFGLEAAVVYNHLFFWLRHNKIKKMHQIEGRTWVYYTYKDIADYLGYLTEKQVKLAVNKLLDGGILIKKNFNQNKFDHTSWYALKDENLLGFSKSLYDEPKRADREDQTGPSMGPNGLYYNTYRNTDRNTDRTHPTLSNAELPDGSEVVDSSSFSKKVKKPKTAEKVDILKDKHLDHILLSKEEHAKLLELHGEKSLLWMMEILNAYIGSKGDKYKSHYPLMCKGGWVCKRLEEEKLKSPTLAPAGSYQRRGKLAISADARAEVTKRPQMKTDHISDQELEEFLARAKTSKEKSK